MRRIVTFNNVSADGYFAAADGGLDWVIDDPELSRSVMETSRVDTALFGRVTYQQFESFWPHAAEDPATPPELRVFADALNKMAKVVFSTTLKRVTWKNSRLLHEIVPAEIERMKQEPGDDIIIFGSASIVQKLTEHGLNR